MSNVTSSNNMFYVCDALEGGNGTAFDANYTDVTYAIIDGTNNQLGYLTFGIKVTPKLVNINGYHCIKPTSPLRTDSARLYIDTDKDGEDYSVNANQLITSNTVSLELTSSQERKTMTSYTSSLNFQNDKKKKYQFHNLNYFLN